ncbi:hypothetical protein AAMO2058_000242600 [Amorphochlora amoebiformis]
MVAPGPAMSANGTREARERTFASSILSIDDSDTPFPHLSLPRKLLAKDMMVLERRGDWVGALDLFEKMTSQVVKPDVSILTSLVRSCYTQKHTSRPGVKGERGGKDYGEGGRGEEAAFGSQRWYDTTTAKVERIMGSVKQSLEIASTGTFRRLLQRLNKAYLWDAVMRLYINLKDPLPEEERYSAMGVVHAVYKQLKNRTEMMIQQTEKPDNKTFGPFVMGTDLFANWRTLKKILVRARALGVFVSEEMYRIVIAACNRFGDHWLAMEEFNQMTQDGIDPSSDCAEEALTALCLAQQWKTAVDAFGRLEVRGIRPKENAYEHLIRACGYTGQWERAMQLFSDMERSPGFFPAYEAMVEALFYSKQYLRVVSFINHLDERPDLFYIDYKMRRYLEKAEKRVNRLAYMSGENPIDYQERFDEMEGYQGGDANQRRKAYVDDGGDLLEDTGKLSSFATLGMIWGAMEDELRDEDKIWEEFLESYSKKAVTPAPTRRLNISDSEVKEVSFQDIPWPIALIPSPITQKLTMRSTAYFEQLARKDATSARKKLKNLILRWHPDKFMQRFPIKIPHRKDVLSRLQILSAGLTQLLGRANQIAESSRLPRPGR